jgi:hypothetical protein
MLADLLTLGENAAPNTGTVYDGWKLLTPANRPGQLPVIDAALMALSEPELLIPVSSDGRGWAHMAAQQGEETFLTQWVARGLPIDQPTQQGFTPLHYAAAAGRDAVAALLLQARAPISAMAKNGWTPLDCAILAKAIPVALRLLAHGASSTLPLPADGLTSLQRAVRENMPEVVLALLERGAIIDARSAASLTALDYAILTRNESLVELLRARKAHKSVEMPPEHPEEQAVYTWLPPWFAPYLPQPPAQYRSSARFLPIIIGLVVILLVLLFFHER